VLGRSATWAVLMPGRVYIETTVISYLTARPSRDVVIAGHQQITREWWESRRERFEIVASQLVLQEASAGDQEAAQQRLAVLADVPLLELSEDAFVLAQALVDSGAVPRQAIEDAVHIAVAVANGVDYLMTWNYRHLANAAMRASIDRICRAAGYEPVVICTPEELLED
jgi:predicted nucleic acid-binding protein